MVPQQRRIDGIVGRYNSEESKRIMLGSSLRKQNRLDRKISDRKMSDHEVL